MDHLFRVLTLAVTITLSLFHTAVIMANHDDTDISASLEELTGTWESEGYGYIVEIEAGTPARYRRYQTSDVSCLLVDSADLAYFQQDYTRVLRNADKTRFTYMIAGNLTTYAYRRIDSLPGPCRDGGTGNDDDPLLNFDVLWATFDEHYAFFERRGVDWDAVRGQYRTQLNASSSDRQLFDVLVQMVSPLCDGHVELTSPFDGYNGEVNPNCWGGLLQHVLDEFENQSQYADPFDYFQSVFRADVLQTIEDHYLAGNLQSAARDKIHWGDLGGGIGYVSLLQMTNYANEDATPKQDLETLAPVLDEIMTDMADKNALVIDIRLNTGGYDHVALDIANRFSGQPRVAFTKKARWGNGYTNRTAHATGYSDETRFSRPIAILTSDVTASAAENFLLAMYSLPSVTLIGETTVGVHSDVLERKLPNGWTFTLSNEVYEAPDGTIFEGRGFEPDIKVTSPRAADVSMGRDFGLETALSRLSTYRMGPGLNDAWYDPETSGQGFFITVFPNLNFVTLAWFTYDTDLPPDSAPANLGDPGHRWITALGTIEGNRSVLDIDITAGGIFNTPTEIRHTDPPGSDGTLTLTFENCQSGTIEFDIPSINQQGVIAIQRVAKDNIALCKALAGQAD